MARGKQLTAVAIRKLWSPWIRHHSVSQDLRLGLYNVKSHCAHIQHGHLGTNANRMAQVLCIPPSSAKMGYRHQIPSANLEQRPKICVQPIEPVRHQNSVETVWTCASSPETPAHLAIDQYFTSSDFVGWRGRPRTTQPTALDNGLQEVGKRLRNQRDLDWLRSHDRNEW